MKYGILLIPGGHYRAKWQKGWTKKRHHFKLGSIDFYNHTVRLRTKNKTLKYPTKISDLIMIDSIHTSGSLYEERARCIDLWEAKIKELGLTHSLIELIAEIIDDDLANNTCFNLFSIPFMNKLLFNLCQDYLKIKISEETKTKALQELSSRKQEVLAIYKDYIY